MKLKEHFLESRFVDWIVKKYCEANLQYTEKYLSNRLKTIQTEYEIRELEKKYRQIIFGFAFVKHNYCTANGDFFSIVDWINDDEESSSEKMLFVDGTTQEIKKYDKILKEKVSAWRKEKKNQ